MPYQYGVLSADLSPSSNAHNSELLGPMTLGIEVTNEALAARCGLGNIDPQHSENRDSSAIEEAMITHLPKAGSSLVTIRPDKDSFGAMAVLSLRALGQQPKINRWLVTWIGAIDREGFDKARINHPELLSEKNTSDAIQAIISIKDDRWPTMTDQIDWISQILTGSLSREEISSIVSLLQRTEKNFEVEMHGEVAFILAPGFYRQARDWGNRRYKVAAVFDPIAPSHVEADGTCQKWTLVRKSGVFDREGFETSINTLEAQARGISVAELARQGLSWGGNQNIISSPRGKGRETVLTKDVVLKAVREHLESKVVS